MSNPQTDPKTPGGGNRSGKAFWLVAIVAVAVAGGVFAWSKITAPPKLVTDVKTSKTFFRMKADYTYTGKNGPEPLSFNIVAGCAIEITQYVFGASPGRSSRVPTMYALPMSDGGAIMIEVPRACGATTQNGRVPEDFMPAVVQYESSEDLSLGMLYASEDAYDSPLAKLNFHGATIEKATQEEFKAFINGNEFKKNLISIESSKDLKDTAPKFTAEVKQDPAAVWKQDMPSRCHGFARIKMPENVRKYLKQYWKPSGPRYWMVSPEHSWKMRFWLRGHVESKGEPNPIEGREVEINGHPFEKYDLNFESWGGGMVTRRGGGSLGARDRDGYVYSYPPEYYPYEASDASPWLKTLPRKPEFLERRISIKPEHKGFMYCYSWNAREVRDYFSDKNIMSGGFPLNITINDNLLEIIDGNITSVWFGGGTVFFENDNYIIWYREFVI